MLRLTENLFVMKHRINNHTDTALLYIHSFKLLPAYMALEEGEWPQTPMNTLTTTADKLRYCRRVKGLEQKYVAAWVGLDRGTYADYEIPSAREYYPLDKLTVLAELFGVTVEYLLDDYHTFLYNGQGRQVRALRESMGLSQEKFAEKFGVWRSSVRKWESDSARMTRSMWEKVFSPIQKNEGR